MTIRRRYAASAAAIALAAVGIVIWQVAGSGGAHAAGTVPTGIARIVRTNVVERQQVAGTLDYAGSFAVSNAGDAGVVTWLPQPGAVVRRGGTLYGRDRRPVMLLYGDRPAFRDLALGVAGQDVRELQQNLLALGFDATDTLRVNHRFDISTLAAVEGLQRSRGLPATGTLALGSVVFLPGPARIGTLTATAGASLPAGAPVLTATGARPAVLVPLDPGSVGRLASGDAVLVTMPDGGTVRGRVADIGRVATPPSSDSGQGGAGGTPTIPVTVDLLDAHGGGGLDQAPVQVSITEQEHDHVLAAPISALLAQPGGGYAVTVITAASTSLVPVTTGLFDDVSGRVEISGAGLRVGVRVEVPSG